VSTTAKPNHTVIIVTVKGTIIDVFASNAKTLNVNLKVENMKGKTMMPGLIEGHYHLASGVKKTPKLEKFP
jgi:imidazolonepropionase-like amidohydrolase